MGSSGIGMLLAKTSVRDTRAGDRQIDSEPSEQDSLKEILFPSVLTGVHLKTRTTKPVLLLKGGI
jgi:hypothetical protein